MVIFEHADITLPECNRKNIDGRRMYLTETGEAYPSITTVLSRMSREGIKAWRERVGAETANKISTQASRRGTAVHKLAEDYLNNKKDWASKAMPSNIQTFNTIKPILDESIDLVYGLEVNLWSDYLGVAGQCDCVCKWNGRNTIVDFKTARKAKKETQIQNYFMQGCAYATALFELHKLRAEQIVILMEIQDEGSHEVFIENPADWIEPLKDLRVQYAQEFGV